MLKYTRLYALKPYVLNNKHLYRYIGHNKRSVLVAVRLAPNYEIQLCKLTWKNHYNQKEATSLHSSSSRANSPNDVKTRNVHLAKCQRNSPHVILHSQLTCRGNIGRTRCQAQHKESKQDERASPSLTTLVSDKHADKCCHMSDLQA